MKIISSTNLPHIIPADHFSVGDPSAMFSGGIFNGQIIINNCNYFFGNTIKNQLSGSQSLQSHNTDNN